MRKSPKLSPEVIERAVRMVFGAKDQYPSQWSAIESIASKIGCTGETLRKTHIPRIETVSRAEFPRWRKLGLSGWRGRLRQALRASRGLDAAAR